MSSKAGDLGKSFKKPHNGIEINENNSDISKSEKDFPISENFLILKELNSILLNCTNLTSIQKLEFCNSQRYFMKNFLKEILGRTRH